MAQEQVLLSMLYNICNYTLRKIENKLFYFYIKIYTYLRNILEYETKEQSSVHVNWPLHLHHIVVFSQLCNENILSI